MSAFKCCTLLPHGALLLDPQQQRECLPEARSEMEAEVSSFVDKMNACCDAVAEDRPDLLVVLTPHGHQCENQFLIYTAAAAEGSAEWNECWSEFRVRCDLDSAVAQALCTHLRASDVPCDTFASFSSSCAITLRWGEVVPLHFIQQAFTRRGAALPPVVVISLPSRRLVFDGGYIEIVRRFTASLLTFFEQSPRRAALVVSGDLAHRHPSPRTHPAPPFPSLDDGQPEAFDALIETWVHVAGTAVGGGHVAQAVELKHVLACGLSGVMVLDDVLRQCSHLRVRAEAVARIHPTYYGMLAAWWGAAT